MNDSRTTETVVCPHCGGCGRIATPSERVFKFQQGQRVTWHYGPHRIPATVIGYSQSGERVRIKSERWGSTFVKEKSLHE